MWIFLFLLLFSGPPKFRTRDPAALVAGDPMDFALYVQIAVWLFAGFWIARDIWRGTLKLRENIHWTVLLFASALGLSLLHTVSFGLSAFKLYQIAITICFVIRFVQKRGVYATLRMISISCLLLSAIIITAIPFLPDLVMPLSETGAPRLRGWGIADASVVSSIALVLIMSGYPKLPIIVREIVCSWLLAVLFFSLTRIAWVAFAFVVLLACFRAAKIWPKQYIRVALIAAMILVTTTGLEFLDEYRDSRQISDLSDRVFLWTFLADETIRLSPYTGLGYFAGSRQLAPEFRPGYGSAHSIFMESFVGAGYLGAATFLLMVAMMSAFALRLWWKSNQPGAFALYGLWFLLAITGMFMSELDSTPFAFTFWTLCVLLPKVRIASKTTSPPA